MWSSLCVPTHELCIRPQERIYYLFLTPIFLFSRQYIKGDGGVDLSPAVQKRNRNLKILSAKNVWGKKRQHIAGWKKKRQHFYTFVHLLHLCKQAWKAALQTRSVPVVLIFRVVCRTLWLATDDAVSLDWEQPTAMSHQGSHHLSTEHCTTWI